MSSIILEDISLRTFNSVFSGEMWNRMQVTPPSKEVVSKLGSTGWGNWFAPSKYNKPIPEPMMTQFTNGYMQFINNTKRFNAVESYSIEKSTSDWIKLSNETIHYMYILWSNLIEWSAVQVWIGN